MNDIRENLQEPSLLPPLMDAITNITVENLRAIAVVQLERITAYQSTINVLSDSINVDELMQRYRARKSYFGLAADWFGQQSLWVKALIGAALVGISYLLSLSYILIGVIYVAIAFLLENHHKTTQEQDELIAEDLLHLKQSLVDSISHLDDVSQIIQNTLTSLCELNIQMTDINAKLEENNTDLEDKISQFKKIVSSLEKNKEDLLSSTAELKIKLEAAYSQIHQHQNEMSSSAQSIVESDRSIGETCAGFRTSLEKFDEYTKDQQAVVAEYEKLSAVLKKKIAEYEQALLELHQDRCVLTDHEGKEDGEMLFASYDQDEVDRTIIESSLICERLEKKLRRSNPIRRNFLIETIKFQKEGAPILADGKFALKCLYYVHFKALMLN